MEPIQHTGTGAREDAPEDAPEDARGVAGYGGAGARESVTAARSWWDQASGTYLDEHGETLGTDALVWGPEGLDEDDAHLLGPVAGLVGARVLEIGCGGGQGARWAAARGATAVGVDTSFGMLTSVPVGGPGAGGAPAPALVQADARALPLPDGWAHLAFSAYGALPFVADVDVVLAEVARVLEPGGEWVFSTSHPLRWGFPDVPGVEGLTATRSYFDRTPYAERDEDGRLLYAEHHRTVGDWVRLLTAAGFVIDDVVEPEWPATRPDGREQPTWGGWSALRGALLPGTAVFVTHRREEDVASARVRLEEGPHGLRAVSEDPMPVLTVEQVRETLEQVRRWPRSAR